VRIGCTSCGALVYKSVRARYHGSFLVVTQTCDSETADAALVVATLCCNSREHLTKHDSHLLTSGFNVDELTPAIQYL
jgi:hypothetical protein